MSTHAPGKKKSTTIKVDYLARVEGEGAMLVKLKGDKVADVKLKIFEPPRLFEGFLRGRHYTEAPDITARICGICHVAYQMTSANAMERALGIEVDPMVRLLRRLFTCGEWIESHALHVCMLHAPDFLGLQGIVEMARDHREFVEKALLLKKAGNDLLALIGGRETHPVSAAVGGFHKVPSPRELRKFRENMKWALDAALEIARFVAAFEFPDFEQDYEFVCLSHPNEYPVNEGRLVSSGGLDITPAEYEDHFVEQQVQHSTALHSALRERGPYLVGPLARINLNHEKLTPIARQVAVDSGLSFPCLNQFKSIIARAVEMVFTCEEALRIIDCYELPASRRARAKVRASTGHAITEAPRGILYHRYSIDDNGLILAARIVPPTSQNQKQIEDDLSHYVPGIVSESVERITWQCEQIIRNYDPCISCACHFLKLRVERE